MTSSAPEDNRFEQFSEAIARLFGRIRDIETRLQSLEVHLGDDLVAAAEVVEPISDMPAIDSSQPELNAPVSELPDSSSTVVPTAVPVDSEVEMALASAVNSTRHDGGTGSIDWESLVGGRLLTWTGAFTLVVAVAFFIPWAWQHFDLPPALRVTIFHVIGLGILIGSQALFRGRLATLAGGLAAVGIFTLYAAAWAAQHHYGLWGQGITFVDCVLITTAAIAIALRNNNVGIIVLGALGGYITPFLASSGEANHIILFSYLAFLNVALITCSVLRSWQFLKPLTLAATALMFLLWVENNALGASELWSTQWLAVLHFVIFLLGTTVPPVLWRQSSTPWDLLTLAGSSTALVGLTWRLYHEHPQQAIGAGLLGNVANAPGIVRGHVPARYPCRPHATRASSALRFVLYVSCAAADEGYLGVSGCRLVRPGTYFYAHRHCFSRPPDVYYRTTRVCRWRQFGWPDSTIRHRLKRWAISASIGGFL